MKVSIKPAIVFASLVIGFCGPASGHQETAGNLKIGHPWVRAVPAGSAGTYGCIIEIKNEGDEPERLLGATVDGAGAGVLYEIVESNGKVTSHKIEGLEIKPHGAIELTPSTYQIRFGKVTKALEEGSMVDGTLVFEKLKSVPIEFMVEPDETAPKEDADAGQADQHEHQHHGM